jgi:hypothetical protein
VPEIPFADVGDEAPIKSKKPANWAINQQIGRQMLRP